MQDNQKKLLALYNDFPFEFHPLWTAVFKGELSLQQIISAEVQHWIRTSAGQRLRRDALNSAQSMNPKIFEQLLETVLEECTNQRGPSHLELIERLVMQGGISKAELDLALPTPGNAAAIALYRDITSRGAGCHMLGAGAVEYYYSALSPRIYAAYTGFYHMASEQAETYSIHGSQDKTHAERAFTVLDEVISLHGWNVVALSVRDAFVATSLHYDGMLQAATGEMRYWNGGKT